MGIDVYSEDWDPAKTLAEDAQGLNLRLVTDALRQGQGKLKRKLDSGVTPDEFKRGQALIGSYDAAIRGMEQAGAKQQRSAP